MEALKAYMNNGILSPNYNALRNTVNTGAIVYNYIRDIAVLTRDLFRKSSPARLAWLATEAPNAIEMDDCWNHRNLIQTNAYVFRTCTNCSHSKCPFNLMFAQYQLR